MGRKRRQRIHAGQRTLDTECLECNDNITIPIGPLTLVRKTFEVMGLPRLLNPMKRDQGASVTEVTEALVSHSMQMQGLSINRMEDILENPHKQQVYGISDDVDKNDLYRTCRILGRNLDTVVGHINSWLTERLSISLKEVFLDWSASYVDGKPTDFIRFGHTKDHRPDRPQVSIGMALDHISGLLCGLTVVSGNTNDTVHFKQTFSQVRPFLDPGCLLVFDAGAYSDENGKLVTKGFHFLTRAQINSSDMKYLGIEPGRWLRLDDDIRAYMYLGNNKRCKVIYYSQKRHDELIAGYYAKAERDYDEAIQLKKMIERDRPRKKYRNSNFFLDTRVGYVFPLDLDDRQTSIERAVQSRITGREGYFILMCSKVMLPRDMLQAYRSRNIIEDAYRDLKHGIDIRPIRCRNEEAIKGRVLIAYLALLSLYLSKYLSPELKPLTAESFVSDLNSFSLTIEVEDGKEVRRVHSNFNPTIRAVLSGFERFSEAIAANRRPKSYVTRWV